MGGHTLKKIRELVAELKAIERWSADQWTLGCTDSIEMGAVKGRRERRTEILAQLVVLFRALD
jgi:hypothetical protein